jgi:hypothetical protein
VNTSDWCVQSTHVSFGSAGLSGTPLPECGAGAQKDVWLSFTALETSEVISAKNFSSQGYCDFAIYSGDCGNLTSVQCEQQNSGALANGLTVGQTYFLRILSHTSFAESFDLCITAPPSCSNAHTVCGVQNYANTVNVPTQGSAGCLFSTPNPTYFRIHIAQSGSLQLNLSQSTFPNGNPDLDVDFAAWGPFASSDQECQEIFGENGFLQPTAGCSYSAMSTETVTMPNVQAGENYVLMVTNFSNQAGYTNIGIMPESTAGIACSGIGMQAFLDVNANGTREAGEPDFPLGSFDFQLDGADAPESAASQNGQFTLYDDDAAHHYALGYEIAPDYAAFYNAPGTYAGIATAAPPLTYLFPVTLEENYQDLSVALSPLDSPLAGGTYTLRVTYSNRGPQPITSGTVTFSAPGAALEVSTVQSGASVSGNLITYNFSDLMPYETRSFPVSMNIPALPQTFIGELWTSSATANGAIQDAVPGNNSASVTLPIAASFDPNDKIEAHGGKIPMTGFGPDDFLVYTIRFENTGTAPATNITVTDKLDQKLNESSLELVASSHPCTMQKSLRTIEWQFQNIGLPVSVPGTNIGKGFVTFRLKPEPGFGIGTLIPNSANIYFDVNPLITTNTWVTEFVAELGNPQFDAPDVSLYPNPAHRNVEVALPNGMISHIAIFDMVGKEVKSIFPASDNASIDVSDMEKGLYLVEVSAADGQKAIRKMLVE